LAVLCCASSPRRDGLVSGSCSSARRSCVVFFQPADRSTNLDFAQVPLVNVQVRMALL
jgi:hypothetical protein